MEVLRVASRVINALKGATSIVIILNTLLLLTNEPPRPQEQP